MCEFKVISNCKDANSQKNNFESEVYYYILKQLKVSSQNYLGRFVLV